MLHVGLNCLTGRDSYANNLGVPCQPISVVQTNTHFLFREMLAKQMVLVNFMVTWVIVTCQMCVLVNAET